MISVTVSLGSKIICILQNITAIFTTTKSKFPKKFNDITHVLSVNDLL